MIKRPMTRINLDKAIGRLAHNDPRKTIDIRMSMANAIVGLPSGYRASFKGLSSGRRHIERTLTT